MKKTISDDKQAPMKQAWIDYCRESDLPQDSLPWDQAGWFGWLDFASMHYHDPLPNVGTSMDWTQQ